MYGSATRTPISTLAVEEDGRVARPRSALISPALSVRLPTGPIGSRVPAVAIGLPTRVVAGAEGCAERCCATARPPTGGLPPRGRRLASSMPPCLFSTTASGVKHLPGRVKKSYHVSLSQISSLLFNEINKRLNKVTRFSAGR